MMGGNRIRLRVFYPDPCKNKTFEPGKPILIGAVSYHGGEFFLSGPCRLTSEIDWLQKHPIDAADM